MSARGETPDLFALPASVELRVAIGPGAVWLRGYVTDAPSLLEGIDVIAAEAPLRNMLTPGGRRMSVAMTNCGRAGWVSDARGYRYSTEDPLTGKPWPAMPAAFSKLAQNAAAAAGFTSFEPDACLVNCYTPGTRLSLHQDKNEHDFAEPIVSVSLGLPATFLFGGASRTAAVLRYRVLHGDVVVWGGQSRLYYHGVAPLAEGVHPDVGARRFNLTLRRAR